MQLPCILFFLQPPLFHKNLRNRYSLKMPPKKTEGAAALKSKPAHASYQDMITDAIMTLKDRNGSSRIKLKKYVKANNQINATDAMFDSLFNKALKAGVEKGVFEQPKGPSGGTKLAKKAKTDIKKEVAPKKKAAPKKKEEKKEPEKKKAAPKKAVAAAAAAPKKAESDKKPSKKAAAPKKAPIAKKEKEEKNDPLKKTKGGRVAKPAAAKPTTKAAAAPKKAAPKKKTDKKEKKESVA